jgi:hypothetical protein
MNTLFRILNVLPLAAILAILVQIRQHMPPTVGEYQNAKRPGQVQALAFRELSPISVDDSIPLSVKIDNTRLSVEVDNTPLSVEVDNEPRVQAVIVR